MEISSHQPPSITQATGLKHQASSAAPGTRRRQRRSAAPALGRVLGVSNCVSLAVFDSLAAPASAASPCVFSIFLVHFPSKSLQKSMSKICCKFHCPKCQNNICQNGAKIEVKIKPKSMKKWCRQPFRKTLRILTAFF